MCTHTGSACTEPSMRALECAGVQVNKALLSVKSQHLIYAVLLARNQLVQFVRPRKTALWAEDLLLIINLINSSVCACVSASGRKCVCVGG